MRIAIIGGKGLIGSALARELVQAGHAPLILSRSAAGSEFAPGIPVQQWDGRDAHSLAVIADGMDGLVNLAGESLGKSRWTKSRVKAIVDSRLQPAQAVVEAWPLMRASPRVLLQASAVGIYGSTDHTVNEESTPAGDFLALLCQKWEAATAAVTQHNTRRVVIRSGIVLDQKRGVLPQMVLPFRLYFGGPAGKGSQWVSWIHIADEVRAIRFLLENTPCRGVFNLTSPYPITNADFGLAISRAIHKPYWFRLPGALLKTALGEMSSLLLEGQRVLPMRLTQAGYSFLYPELDSALAELLVSSNSTGKK